MAKAARMHRTIPMKVEVPIGVSNWCGSSGAFLWTLSTQTWRRDVMGPLRPIFWGQGMFLQPQHFQQHDCYHEARLQRYLHWLFPFCWGVKSLVINETAL